MNSTAAALACKSLAYCLHQHRHKPIIAGFTVDSHLHFTVRACCLVLTLLALTSASQRGIPPALDTTARPSALVLPTPVMILGAFPHSPETYQGRLQTTPFSFLSSVVEIVRRLLAVQHKSPEPARFQHTLICNEHEKFAVTSAFCGGGGQEEQGLLYEHRAMNF